MNGGAGGDQFFPGKETSSALLSRRPDGEWSRADYDARHRLNLLGTSMWRNTWISGVGLHVNSGMPYTETTGAGQYHMGYANARPPGMPRNSLQGPGFAELDLRWSHCFLLEHKKEGPRFTVALDAFNAANRVSYVTYVGDLLSPFSGRPVAAKPPRVLQLSGRFEFLAERGIRFHGRVAENRSTPSCPQQLFSGLWSTALRLEAVILRYPDKR